MYSGRVRPRPNVEPVQATLTLRPSRYATQAFYLVSFHADRVPTGGGNYGIPLAIQQWLYTQDDGVVVNPGCPAGSNPTAWDCSYGPQKSGTMTVTARVNGVPQTQSVHIRVICQPTGDPLFDSLPVLDAIAEAWKLGNATNLDPTQRRERPWSVDCSQGGICTYTVYPSGATTPCTAAILPLDPSGTRRAEGHTHGLRPVGLANPDSLPSSLCPPSPGQPYSAFVWTTLGPSPSRHYQILADSRRKTPHIVAEPDYMWVVPVGTNIGSLIVCTQPVPRRDGGSCSRYWRPLHRSPYQYANATLPGMLCADSSHAG